MSNSGERWPAESVVYKCHDGRLEFSFSFPGLNIFRSVG